MKNLYVKNKILNYFNYSPCRSIVNWSLVLGKKGSLKVSYLLAKKYIEEGKCITATEVNKVLAFAPNHITTGSTLKVFAESGKLFKDKYKITINTKDDK